MFVPPFLPWSEIFIENLFGIKHLTSSSSPPPYINDLKYNWKVMYLITHLITEAARGDVNISILGKGMGSGGRPPWLESWLHHLLAVSPWASSTTCLEVSFLVCTNGEANNTHLPGWGGHGKMLGTSLGT